MLDIDKVAYFVFVVSVLLPVCYFASVTVTVSVSDADADADAAVDVFVVSFVTLELCAALFIYVMKRKKSNSLPPTPVE